MPTGSRLTLASLSTLFRKSYYSTGGRRGLQRGRGFKGIVVWDWAKKLIGLDCVLSFLIWLSFSFKSQWLDGIRHIELFCSVFCFGLFYGANLRPKFNLGNYVCLWFELKDKIKNKQTGKKPLTLSFRSKGKWIPGRSHSHFSTLDPQEVKKKKNEGGGDYTNCDKSG